MSQEQEQNLIQWIYSARDNPELEERYDQWAASYDQDLDADYGWLGPQKSAETLARYVPKNARILDAGAGTGLVGRFLHELGYHDLTAMDMSTGMLEEAAKKNVYKEFHRMVMGEPLDFPSDSFDAVISVGVMTVGHAPAGSLDELVRITRPGGHIVFTLRPDVYEEDGFKEKQSSLEANGKWSLMEQSENYQTLPKGEPDIYHQVWAYQVK